MSSVLIGYAPGDALPTCQLEIPLGTSHMDDHAILLDAHL